MVQVESCKGLSYKLQLDRLRLTSGVVRDFRTLHSGALVG